MKVIFSPRSKRDLDMIFNYFNEHNPWSAARVIDAIQESIDRLRDHPNQGSKSTTAGIRIKLVRRYRFQIFYRVQDDTIGIVHIRHTARVPFVPET